MAKDHTTHDDDVPHSAPADVAADWADDYEEGAELFGATFDADDFDTEYGDEYPDGTTVAVKRCTSKPTPGWIRKHAHMSDLERTFALIEKHSAPRALDILDSLKEEPWQEFMERWGRDGGLIEGKSPRSSRRSGR